MFERFTRDTRRLMMRAVDEASALQHRHAGTGHILTALLADRDGPAAALLEHTSLSAADARHLLREAVGSSTTGIDDADAAALREIGLDVEDVRRSTEALFGTGALAGHTSGRPTRRLSTAARDVPMAALKLGKRLRHRRLDTRHLLLALLDQPGPTTAQLILDRAGVDRARLRESVATTLGA